MRHSIRNLILFIVPLTALPAIAIADEANAATDKRALAVLQAYVGQWRGVGQPKRGSNQGAWTESCEWSWRFDNGRAELCATLEHDPHYSRICVRPGAKAGEFAVAAESAANATDNAAQQFTGTVTDGALVVVDPKSPGDRPARISLRLVADGDRMTILYEKRLSADTYGRLAEVGATRKGSSFAKNAASGPECVVTGGLGTIAVEHNGKKYFVCCSGCRELFNDDPEGVLAEYRERKTAEAAEKAKP